jgi:hypothetical protein
MSLLYTTQLFLNVHSLHLLEARRIFGRIWLSIVGSRCLLASSYLLFRYGHASHTIVDIVTLTSEALEVIRSLVRSDDCRVSGFGLGSLLLPTRVKKLN